MNFMTALDIYREQHVVVSELSLQLNGERKKYKEYLNALEKYLFIHQSLSDTLTNEIASAIKITRDLLGTNDE